MRAVMRFIVSFLFFYAVLSLVFGCVRAPPPPPVFPTTHLVTFEDGASGAQVGWVCVRDPAFPENPALRCMDLELFLLIAKLRGAPRPPGEIEL